MMNTTIFPSVLRRLALLCILLMGHFSEAQELDPDTQQGLDYFLPQNISYDPAIPTPESVVGHQVGEWHITHDKLVFYLQQLAASSDRIQIENRGSTYEGRPLLLLTVSHPDNLARLEDIRQKHVGATEGGPSAEQEPIVVYQGFSIHGNEPSGSNAALLYAYYLAAAKGPAIDQLLREEIILLDPSFNPDGLQRFAYWANVHRSKRLNPDPNDREYREVWPGGRTNHYWFDMNRDWLTVQLPESRARIKSFHQWMPNILTDHHEMGTNSTFFFQPGEPSRVHPFTPDINQQLTKKIAGFHARALDKIGSLYYSEENYDDYFYGKGSAFPDVNGGIGILFEQGSSRGHVQESENGLLTFAFTIRNQFTTALSTIEAAQALRPEILKYQHQYFKELQSEGQRSKTKAFVFGDAKDPARAYHLAEILERQKIKVHRLNSDSRIQGQLIPRDHGFVVPLAQKNPRLIRTIFEKRTTFADSLFYDVSAWTMPLAFNLSHEERNSLSVAGPEITDLKAPEGSVSARSRYAYLFEWHHYYSPRLLNALLENGLRAKVAKSPFILDGKSYDYGTIMIPVVGQKLNPEELYTLMQKEAKLSGITVTAASTGLTQGIDLGSNDFDPVRPQKVAVLVGNGVRSYDAGEIWHLFDQRYNMRLTKLDVSSLERADLSRYTDIIIPSYSGSFSKRSTENLKEFVREGGTLIGFRSTVRWMNQEGFLKLDFIPDSLVAKNIRFDQKGDFFGAQVTGGAIFEAHLDLSHPVGYGYTTDKISLFRNTNFYIKPAKNSYDNPIRYTQKPLQSGYISEENAKRIAGSVPFRVARFGRGRVMAFTDNTNFRAFWFGTNKLMMNSIFFGPQM